MSEIFEEPVEKIEEPIIEKELVEPEKPKKGKHKKPMSAERRAALSEQLKKARLVSQQKRGAKSKEKKLKKLKEIESNVEDSMVENIKKKVLSDLKPINEVDTNEIIHEKEISEVKKISEVKEVEDIETRIEKRLRLKLEKEYANTYDHKLKDYKILSLQERLSDYKQTKKLEVIKEEEKKKEPKPKVMDNISPMNSRNLMDKYRRIRGGI
tara:strand:+ start:70 stop:702 length:633 start_codon:yes stop_codon:yes gene_type:complete